MATKQKIKKEKPIASRSFEAKVYNAQGEVVQTIVLPEAVFGVRSNSNFLHQVITTMQANKRTPIAHAKTRGEVSGGGKKPWRQKGTGRARHGSIRSPLWRGGGVAHGPRNDKVYARTLPRGMRTKALAVVLSNKWKDGEIIFVDALTFDAPKTKMAHAFLGALGNATGLPKMSYMSGKRTLVAIPEKNDALTKSFRNLPGSAVEEVRNIDPLSLLTYRYLVIAGPETSLELLAKRIKA